MSELETKGLDNPFSHGIDRSVGTKNNLNDAEFVVREPTLLGRRQIKLSSGQVSYIKGNNSTQWLVRALVLVYHTQQS